MVHVRVSHGIRRLAVDFDDLPHTIDQSTPATVRYLIMGFGGFAWLLGVLFVLSGPGGLDVFDIVVLAVFLAVGSGIMALGYRLVRPRRRVITFTPDAVEVDAGKEGDWRVPYREFEGLMLTSQERRVDSRDRRRSGGDVSVTVGRHDRHRRKSHVTGHSISLIHGDEEKSIRLFYDIDVENPREILEGYARTLNLPVLEKSADGYVVRDVEDLDKSVKELAAEGKIEHAFDPNTPPPKGLMVGPGEQGGKDALEVSIKARGVPLYLCFFGVPFVLAGVIFTIGLEETPALGLLLVAFGLLFVFSPLFDVIFRRQVVVTREAFWVRRRLPFGIGTFGDTMIPLDEVEGVRVDEKGRVVVSSDEGDLKAGKGLSDEALAWLRDYVVAGLVTA